MMLVQKPTAFPISSPHNIHRRHPSAPAPVVVQPTRTPGLLTLSKPIQQQTRQKNSPKPRQAVASKITPRQQHHLQEVAPALKPSPEIVQKKHETPEKPSPRGRQHHSKPKDKLNQRSSSQSSLRGRRNNARQPSPPLPSQLSSQAEASSSPPKFTTSNLFDPFLDDSAPPARSKQVRPAPMLTSRPTGKLAKRRQSNAVPFNPAPTPATTPSKAIPLPKRHNSANQVLSRSAPVNDHVPIRKSKATTIEAFAFPICDDVSEMGDDSESEDSAPVTPTRTRSTRLIHGYDDGPRTAPIAVSSKSFPFSSTTTPSPAASKRPRKHTRVPSEGVFAMSSDEEPSSSGMNAAEWKEMFGMFARRRPTVSLTESEREQAAAAAAAAYFASSNFQNSPSPEDLPPPSFV